ncbi:MAG: phosphopentomutase [Chloroflexota bacterium]
MKRVILIVLDSVGCGDAPDVSAYGDEGSNTLGNIAEVVGGLNLPNLQQMGLGNLTHILGVPPTDMTVGAYGRLTEQSAGKDTTTGHWELAGVPLPAPFPLYPDGFPDDVMSNFEKMIGRGTLGNYPASGTEIIKTLGETHLQTGEPIVYTSGDSVFQIAAHIDIIPLAKLYQICETARSMLTPPHAVGRVIARPFVGQPGNFIRTEDRKDFSLTPPSDTILDVLKSARLAVIGVGKIEDIFAHRGLTHSNHTGNNMAGVDAIIEFCRQDMNGLIFANLVDFDSLYGHRNNPRGYADALEAFDARLPDIQGAMHPTDVLMITADHGNDPTTLSTDHSRERVPILISGQPIAPSTNIGTRDCFADVAATIADCLSVDWSGAGDSFGQMIRQ